MNQQDLILKLKDLVEEVSDKVSDIEWNVHEEVLREIEKCPPTREVNFSCCKISSNSPIEDIYVFCPKCKLKVKVRAFGAYRDIEDVLLASRRFFEKRKEV